MVSRIIVSGIEVKIYFSSLHYYLLPTVDQSGDGHAYPGEEEPEAAGPAAAESLQSPDGGLRKIPHLEFEKRNLPTPTPQVYQRSRELHERGGGEGDVDGLIQVGHVQNVGVVQGRDQDPKFPHKTEVIERRIPHFTNLEFRYQVIIMRSEIFLIPGRWKRWIIEDSSWRFSSAASSRAIFCVTRRKA